jgi:acid-sensing ion channel, other
MDWKKGKFLKLVPTNFRHQTKEFFGNSTLHGVRYIAEKGLSFGEKFMWFSCVAIGAVAAFVIIDSLWEKFQTNPTITGIALINLIIKFQFYLFLFTLIDLGLDTDFHNQQMEFPTVSVCPLDPFDEDKVNETAYRVLADYEDNYFEYFPILEMLSKLSYENMEMAYQEVSNLKAKLDNEKKTTLRQLVFKVAVLCEDLFYDCSFRGESIPCCDYFKPIYTERGFCYGFNSRYIGAAGEE